MPECRGAGGHGTGVNDNCKESTVGATEPGLSLVPSLVKDQSVPEFVRTRFLGASTLLGLLYEIRQVSE